MSVALKPMEIVLVEDNPADVRLTQEAFSEHGILTHLTIARDGEEALTVLREWRQRPGNPSPDLVILDLNLPRRDGREVLKVIKEDPGLRHVPVIVLTTSSNDSDVVQAYNLHANCYILKPVDLNQFFSVVQQIEKFWIQTVLLSRKSA